MDHFFAGAVGFYIGVLVAITAVAWFHGTSPTDISATR